MKEPISSVQIAPSVGQICKTPQRFDSRALFHDAQEIVIIHAGQEYRMRITRSGKLILTK
ncbi:MAG: hemin uptake protein HemP [Candidatus Competibacteraceae bacterium]|jgi:hemin uptake protein HemP|nr:hemin uptake protein HemP [Candidatus Competibacteraceae bacterium]